MLGSINSYKATFKSAALGACSLFALQATDAAAQTASANLIKPLYGNISPFYGNLSPFYGNLSPLYGNLNPFYGNLSPFYGNLSPFYGNISPFWGDANPFVANTTAAVIGNYGAGYDLFWGGENHNPYVQSPSSYVKYAQIAGFWSAESANWSKVQSAWSTAQTSGDYATVAGLLRTTILAPAQAFWGNAIQHGTAAQQAATQPALAALANSGVTFNADGTINAASLASVSPTDQALLFLNLYDSLMAYSGTGHVDWRMGATHWSPALAAIAVSGLDKSNPITVGMLDFTVTSSTKNAKGTLLQYGSDVFSNGHGAAVGSLIIGSIDGSGIMGVLPSGAGRVVVYDPYDATSTTNWDDVAIGIQTLANSTFSRNGAPTGVLNASLGVPGWTLHPGWNGALSSGAAHGHNLVIAAGNDGVTQTTNVPWNFAINPNLIIVGSVGVDRTISNFSNRPGEACLIATGAASSDCIDANKLKHRFIVAPGELVLVADGAGGVVRQSGTSLAAPQVAGAIALLQARWPWLANFPDETAQVILKSATPLGTNPGADAVYGVGELNIQASQSPLNWASLRYFPVTDGKVAAAPVSVASIVTTVSTGSPASWNASKFAITALETIGATQRDFQIPLASTLVGQTVPKASSAGVYQAYLTSDLKAWVAGGGKFVASGATDPGLSHFMAASAPMGRVMGMDLRMATTPRSTPFGFTTTDLASNIDFALIGSRSSLRFGLGEGAAAMGPDTGAAQRSDFQARRGGANPLLSLASGGAFLDWRLQAFDRLTFSLGATQRRDARDLVMLGVANSNPARVYEASAEHLGVDYAAGDRVVFHTGLIRLHEQSGLLGFQSINASQLGGGSTTTGMDLGFDWRLSHGFALSGTGTLARTVTASNQALSAAPGGLLSSAAELALSKSRVFGANDRLRLALSQSLQVYSGRLTYASFGVIDRQTGELGVVSQSTEAGGGPVPWAAEVMYGRLLPKQGAEVSAFVRTEANIDDPASGRGLNYMVGGKYRLTF